MIPVNHEEWSECGIQSYSCPKKLIRLLFVRQSRQQKEYQNHINGAGTIINQINENIREINKLKESVSINDWKTLRRVFHEKNVLVNKKMNSLQLNDKSSEVTWFKTISNDLQKTLGYFLSDSNVDKQYSSYVIFSESLEELFASYKIGINKALLGLTILSKSSKDAFKESARKEELNEQIERLEFLEQKIDDMLSNTKKYQLPPIELPYKEKKTRIEEKIKFWTPKHHSLIKTWMISYQSLLISILGDSDLLPGDSVSKNKFREIINDEINLAKRLASDKGFSMEISSLNDEMTRIECLEEQHEQIKSKFIKKKQTSDFYNASKRFYLIGTAIISIPASFVVADSFTGPIWANIAIALATGFGIYRIKDVKDLFKKE